MNPMKKEEDFIALFERVFNGLLIKKGYSNLYLKITLENRNNMNFTRRVNPIKRRLNFMFPNEFDEKGSFEPFLLNSIYGFILCLGKDAPIGENTYITVDVLLK